MGFLWTSIRSSIRFVMGLADDLLASIRILIPLLLLVVGSLKQFCSSGCTATRATLMLYQFCSLTQYISFPCLSALKSKLKATKAEAKFRTFDQPGILIILILIIIM